MVLSIAFNMDSRLVYPRIRTTMRVFAWKRTFLMLVHQNLVELSNRIGPETGIIELGN